MTAALRASASASVQRALAPASVLRALTPASVLALQARVLAALSKEGQTAEQIAGAMGAADAAETVYLLLEHLASNPL